MTTSNAFRIPSRRTRIPGGRAPARLAAAGAAIALALAACGSSGSDESGSDGDATGDTAAPVDEQLDGSADPDQETAGEGEDSTDDGGDGSGSEESGSGGAGTNDETQEQFDEAGIDLDLDDLEDTVTNFSTGSGGGVVTIDGVAYSFEAEVCIAQGPSFVAAGVASGPDGTPAWVDISYSNDFDFDGDGEFDETLDVTVEVGKSELFGSGADDQPRWSASKIDGATLKSGENITVDFSGDSISGAGPIEDFNAVAIAFGDTVPMTFEASCG